MTPNYIVAVANQVDRARRDALLFGAHSPEQLIIAEFLLRECGAFAQAVADSKAINPDAVSRLISAVLGFEARCTGAVADAYKLDEFRRHSEGVNPLDLIPNLLTSPNIKEDV